MAKENRSRLLELPRELQTQIFRDVDDAPGQICLALSCKAFARISKRFDLTHLVTETSACTADNDFTINAKRGDMAKLADLLVSWAKPQDHRHLATCTKCHKTRRQDQSWKEREWDETLRKMGLSERFEKGRFSLKHLLKNWSTEGTRPICPSCLMRDRVDVLTVSLRGRTYPEIWKDGGVCPWKGIYGP